MWSMTAALAPAAGEVGASAGAPDDRARPGRAAGAATVGAGRGVRVLIGAAPEASVWWGFEAFSVCNADLQSIKMSI